MTGLDNFRLAPGYLIRRCHQIVDGLFIEATAAENVSPTQLGVLVAIVAHPGRDQATIAQLIGIDRSTMGTNVERLEAAGYIARFSAPRDRRSKLLTITPAGVDAIRTIERCVATVSERFLSVLGDTERTQFIEAMAQLISAHTEAARTRPQPSTAA